MNPSDRTAGILMMAGAASLFSLAGVVTRHLSPELVEHNRIEIPFWRSIFAAIAVAIYLAFTERGLRAIAAAGRPGLVCGVMWAVMFSAFMIALTLTTTANALLTMSVGPLLTALIARAVFGTPIAAPTWAAIAVAMGGMTWMFSSGASFDGRHLIGMLVAFAVPLAAAINLATMQRMHTKVDLFPAVLLGGILSALAMLPFALPFRATGLDVALLAFLAMFQLALPCALMVMASRRLSATEISLLALLEVVLGPLWAWLGAGEVPAAATLYGGALVLAALVFNHVAFRRRASISA